MNSKAGNVPTDAEVSAAVSVLVRNDISINFVALDFDATFIDIHTGGRWVDTAAELAVHIRPSFAKLVPALVQSGIAVAIVTFSQQVALIKEVMQITFPSFGSQIIIRGRDGSWGTIEELAMKKEDGKQKYIASAAAEIETTQGKSISRASTLLVDDDVNNIRVALLGETRAIWFNPDEPDKLIPNLQALN